MGSQEAKELRYGYGMWLPDETPEQKAAREAGLVRGRCSCTRWWLVPKHVNQPCRLCGQPMKVVAR